MGSFRIAVAQLTITQDATVNGSVIRRLMRRAAEEQARLVVFPQGALSGYAKEQITTWNVVDWPNVREELLRITQLAAELGIWVTVGSAHPLTPPNRPHNSLYVISDKGQIVNRYDKRFCSHTEINRYFTPGFDAATFEVDGFRFGCAICVEVNFPELFAEYERLGVDCVLLPAYPVDSALEVKARSHAAINNYWLALSTPAQTTDFMRSELIDPYGDVLVQVAASEEIAVGEIDRDSSAYDAALNRARPWKALARAGEIYRNRRVEDPRSTDRTCY